MHNIFNYIMNQFNHEYDIAAHDDEGQYIIIHNIITNRYVLWVFPNDTDKRPYIIYSDKNIDKVKLFLMPYLFNPICHPIKLNKQ